MKLKLLSLALVSSGLVAAGTASAIDWHPSAWFGDSARTRTSTPNVSNSENKPGALVANGSVPNYRAIVQQSGPAVVGITTEGISKASASGLPEGLEDHPFFKYFGDTPGFGGQMPGQGMPVRGQGSGFIVSKDGLILTNAHVIDNAEEVTVKLDDRREFKAKVLGSDRATDVAVLKIDAKDLPVVAIGDPARLGVGDHVLAIGSPFGLEQSATAGIVSAKSRSLPGDGYVPFIQTDVAVNPGNSGGPLFDANGNVVGINSQIYSRTGGYQGVSFAIPIDVALNVKDQIVSTGKVVRPRLGVTIQELDQSLADSFKLSNPNGALVSSVAPGSAAEKAGLQPGDVILKYNGEPIVHSGDLSAMVALGKAGQKVPLEIWRSGKKLELSAELAASAESLASKRDASSLAHKGKLGLAVRPLTQEELGSGNRASGVMVAQSSGAAAKAGIEAGDIILSANGTRIETVDQLSALVEKESKQVVLLVQRRDNTLFVPIKFG
ncbi:Do family serine endopeptidase [Oxalobacteraceae bacterium R-40]|uniref:Probable periplasmic serine endoprotease DegP-like n=1 Tax=Keguizhuia sedimenti TaxID=3064264 RepID=A0ABU1BP15_9BURK|nr:Do family serine endopeptidase [Oxalobacteraceae bacterium R-40]